MTAPTKGLAALKALNDWAQELLEQGQTRAAARVAEMVAEGVGIMEGRLLSRHQSGNNEDMVTAERVRHSKGSVSVDPLKKAANDRGYTIRSLAEKLSISHALLSKARKGERSIEKALAAQIQELTGFPATKKNWPGLKE